MGVCEEALQCHLERLFWNSDWHGLELGNALVLLWEMEMRLSGWDDLTLNMGDEPSMAHQRVHLQRGTSHGRAGQASNLAVQEWQTAVIRE